MSWTIMIAATGSQPSNWVEIATLVVAVVAALLALANVVLSAWLSARNGKARWRRDRVLAVLVEFLTDSREHVDEVYAAGLLKGQPSARSSERQDRSFELVRHMQVALFQPEALADAEIANPMVVLVRLHSIRSDIANDVDVDRQTVQRWSYQAIREHHRRCATGIRSHGAHFHFASRQMLRLSLLTRQFLPPTNNDIHVPRINLPQVGRSPELVAKTPRHGE